VSVKRSSALTRLKTHSQNRTSQGRLLSLAIISTETERLFKLKEDKEDFYNKAVSEAFVEKDSRMTSFTSEGKTMLIAYRPWQKWKTSHKNSYQRSLEKKLEVISKNQICIFVAGCIHFHLQWVCKGWIFYVKWRPHGAY